MMRILALAAVALAAIVFAPAPARAQAPWCAWYDWTTYNCGFFSLQQCLDTVRGAGGTCRRNPRVSERPAPVKKPRYRDRR
jgi:hypothetical protein